MQQLARFLLTMHVKVNFHYDKHILFQKHCNQCIVKLKGVI